MIKVWLDDERIPPPGWIHLKTAVEAVEFLKSRALEIEEMSFDHDLGYQGPSSGLPEDGNDVAKALEELAYHQNINPEIRLSIHSSNSAGVKEIKLALGSALRFLGRNRDEVQVLDYLRDILPRIQKEMGSSR